GSLDCVVTDRAGARVAVLSGDGLGRFSPPRVFDTFLFPSAVVVVDLDRDGRADLAVPCLADLDVLRGDGAGGFSPGGQFPIPAIVDGAAADFDADGWPDLVLVGAGAKLYFNNGAGGFRAPVSLAFGFQLAGAGVADLDHDGDADIAAGSEG